MIRLKWKGATLDPSGYGSANRDYLHALHDKAGVDITVEPWNHEARTAEFYGEKGAVVESLKNRDVDYQFVMHHYVPNAIEPKYEPGKVNIGYSTWEADRIPQHWVNEINKYIDLQLVPSYYNKRAYLESGVHVPVEVLPHCLDVEEFDNASALQTDFDDRFKFLSVFQWIERKNPIGLLKAYFSEFYKNPEDVILVLKTYGLNFSSSETERIKQLISRLKEDMRLPQYPPVYVIGGLIPRSQMVSLYKACDCFVLPTRSEGFGIPFAEACAAESTVIATNYGGQTEFLLSDFSDLIDYQLTPVCHMQFPNYDSIMLWAEPDLIQFRDAMRLQTMTTKDISTSRKRRARKGIDSQLNPDSIAFQFIGLLQEYFSNVCV